MESDTLLHFCPMTIVDTSVLQQRRKDKKKDKKDRTWHRPLTRCFLLMLYLYCHIPFTLAIQMAPPNNARHLSQPSPLSSPASTALGTSHRRSGARAGRGRRRDLTDGRTEGRTRTGGVDSGQTAGVRPLPGESRPPQPPPLPFAVTEMEGADQSSL